MKKTSLAIAVALLSGCGSTSLYNDVGDKNDQARHSFANSSRQINHAASYTPAPSRVGDSFAIDKTPAWLKTWVGPKVLGDAPISLLMDKLLEGQDITVEWGYEIDPQVGVAGRIPATTLKRALDIIASRTGYVYTIEEKERKIIWEASITKTFPISYIGANYDYQIGSRNKGGLSQDTEGVSSFADGEDSFSVVSGEELDIYAEIKENIEVMVGDAGNISMSRTAGTAVVTALPAAMKKVERYFDQLDKMLNQQVMLNIRIVRFTGDKANRRGINWDAVRSGADGLLSFAGSLPNATGFSSAPSIVNYTSTSGTSDGSNLIIQALDEQGDVSIVTEPRVVAQVNRVVELELGNVQGYLAEADVTQSANIDILPSVDLRASYVEEGYFLFAAAKVTKDNNVILHLASRFQDLLEISTKTVGLSSIETPKVSRNRFVQTVVLRNGSTLVINSLKQQVSENGRLSPLNAEYMPTSQDSKSQIVETLVMVTPVVMDMR